MRQYVSYDDIERYCVKYAISGARVRIQWICDAQLIRKVIDDNGMLLADMARFFGKCPAAISKMLMSRGCSLAAANRGRPRAIALVQCEEDGVNDEEEDVEVEFAADADAVMTLDDSGGS
jgi:hypothetical protein